MRMPAREQAPERGDGPECARMKPLRSGSAGHRHGRLAARGTVLRRNEEEITRRAGRPIRITWIATRTLERARQAHARREGRHRHRRIRER